MDRSEDPPPDPPQPSGTRSGQKLSREEWAQAGLAARLYLAAERRFRPKSQVQSPPLPEWSPQEEQKPDAPGVADAPEEERPTAPTGEQS